MLFVGSVSHGNDMAADCNDCDADADTDADDDGIVYAELATATIPLPNGSRSYLQILNLPILQILADNFRELFQ